MKGTKKLLQKHELCKKEKVHIMNFSDKENIDIMDFWSKRRFFSTQEVGRKIFLSIYENLHDILRTETDDLSVLKKTVR